MGTDEAFPEAVDKVIGNVMPCEIYYLEDALLRQEHGQMVSRFPRDIVKLANAMIDPTCHELPRDLGEFLDNCLEADPEISSEQAYRQLDGYRRSNPSR